MLSNPEVSVVGSCQVLYENIIMKKSGVMKEGRNYHALTMLSVLRGKIRVKTLCAV